MSQLAKVIDIVKAVKGPKYPQGTAGRVHLAFGQVAHVAKLETKEEWLALVYLALERAGFAAGLVERLVADAIVEQVAPSARTPVCSTCNDTHEMEIRANSYDETNTRMVPCTFCPTPCESCRGHLSAYCKTTACGCACHTRARFSGP
jgi:hypothetical protein